MKNKKSFILVQIYLKKKTIFFRLIKNYQITLITHKNSIKNLKLQIRNEMK